jgi:hypothetical protein
MKAKTDSMADASPTPWTGAPCPVGCPGGYLHIYLSAPRTTRPQRLPRATDLEKVQYRFKIGGLLTANKR